MAIQLYDREKAKPISLPGDGRHGACLVIHGFAGVPGQMKPLCDALAARGFAVEAPLLPGHGATMQDMGRASTRQWVRCVRALAGDLRARYGRVYVTGISAGGILSLLLAQEGRVDAIAPIGAPVFLYTPLHQLSRFVRSFFVRARRKQPDPAPSAADGEEAAPVRGMKWLFQELFVMRSGMKKALRAVNCYGMTLRCALGLHRVACPAVIIQSVRDEMARPSSAGIICRRIRSAEKSVVWLQGSSHIRMLFGPERNTVFSAVGDLFERADDAYQRAREG